MEYLFENRAPQLPADALAEVFDRLVWCLSDNGAELLKVREAWILSDDKERVEIGITMGEFFPFLDPGKMEDVLCAVAEKWPEFGDRCNYLIQSRRKQ